MATQLETIFGKGVRGNDFVETVQRGGRRNTSNELAQASQHTLENILAITHVPVEWLQEAMKIAFPPIHGTIESTAIPKSAQYIISNKAVAFETAWGEDSPLTQYATSLLIANALVEKHATMSDRIANIDKRNFAEPGQREAALANETALLTTLSQYLPQLTGALDTFAQEQWGIVAPIYHYVLQTLIAKSKTDFTLTRSKGTGVNKDHVFTAVKEGRITEAMDMLDSLFGPAQ